VIFEYTLQLAQEMRLQALVISIVAVLDAEKNLILYLSFRIFLVLRLQIRMIRVGNMAWSGLVSIRTTYIFLIILGDFFKELLLFLYYPA
jgi:hypothetical protein